MENRGKHPQLEVVGMDDFADISIRRGRSVEQIVRLGPNLVHAGIVRGPSGLFGEPGTYEDLGVSQNLLTNVGRDLLSAALGQPTQKDGVVTAATSTSATPSGGGMTADQYKGWRVWMPVTGLTTAPVYGNIGSNTTTVLTVDGWWVGTSDTMTGTTPAGTSGYFISPAVEARFMGLTTDSAAANATDVVLATEITTNGCNRAKATYAHTPGAATLTLTNAYSVGGTFTAIHKAGLFTAANTTAAGILTFETVLNQDATVGNGDTLTVTWTCTLSG